MLFSFESYGEVRVNARIIMLRTRINAKVWGNASAKVLLG